MTTPGDTGMYGQQTRDDHEDVRTRSVKMEVPYLQLGAPHALWAGTIHLVDPEQPDVTLCGQELPQATGKRTDIVKGDMAGKFLRSGCGNCKRVAASSYPDEWEHVKDVGMTAMHGVDW